MKDESAVRDYRGAICSSGMYFFDDEIEYGQKKYNKALAAAGEFTGGLPALEAFLKSKMSGFIIQEGEWTPLWKLIQELQAHRLSDFPQHPLPEWRRDRYYDAQPYTHEELEVFRNADVYNVFIAEVCLLNALLAAGSEHC